MRQGYLLNPASFPILESTSLQLNSLCRCRGWGEGRTGGEVSSRIWWRTTIVVWLIWSCWNHWRVVGSWCSHIWLHGTISVGWHIGLVSRGIWYNDGWLQGPCLSSSLPPDAETHNHTGTDTEYENSSQTTHYTPCNDISCRGKINATADLSTLHNNYYSGTSEDIGTRSFVFYRELLLSSEVKVVLLDTIDI